MEIQITEQLRSFLLAILLGMAVGVVYDLMRAVRLRHPRLTAVLDLDRLPLLKKIVDIIDIGVGDLGDMYKAGPAALQGYEGAEFCDAGDLAL